MTNLEKCRNFNYLLLLFFLIFLPLLFLTHSAQATEKTKLEVDVLKAPEISILENAMSRFKVSGRIITYVKTQDSYYTPLDTIFDVRPGANYREDQHFRTRFKLNLSYGSPSEQWFGLAQIDLDVNDPDSDGNNKSNNNFDLDSFFLMYRPFEVSGGRPIGIKFGIIPIKATANAAYFHSFGGDIDSDFIFYTATGLPEVPGFDIDFHISKDTGFGYAYANGVDDASEIIALVSSESTQNHVFWAEAKKWGFGFNGAIQFVKGEFSPSDEHHTPAGNTFYSYNGNTKHIVVNSLLSYRFDLGNFGFMPVIGYELVKGEQAATGMPPLDTVRDVKWENFQIGLNIFTEFFNTPGKFSILYTKSETDNIDDTLNESVFQLAGIDHDLHVEYGLNLTDNIKAGIFYYKLYTRDINVSSAALLPVKKAFEYTDTQSCGMYVKLSF